MNIGIISEDINVSHIIENKINYLMENQIIQKYKSFFDFLETRKNFKLDALCIDLDLKDWKTKTIEIQTYYQNIKIMFLGHQLSDYYQLYDMEYATFVSKKELECLEDALHALFNACQKREEHYIQYKWKNITYIQKTRNIIYFERDKRRTIIHQINGQISFTYKSLDDFIKETNDEFIRTHEKYLVNPYHFEICKRDKIQMQDGTIIPISRKYLTEFRNKQLIL
ncbi:LytTR family transcriptional regulator DNA-binding domain-containing protein [Floccifex sp.]|uniref:LytTR family transcriptional regulator DNA-binding domain-containing protein n=1 Tax=Floccifex sp. TaxID=2815810 RepID=UPI003F0318F9